MDDCCCCGTVCPWTRRDHFLVFVLTFQARRTDFGGGAAMEGGSGGPPAGKFSKIEANCKHFQVFGAISVYGNYNESLLILQQTKKTPRSGTNITLPGKNFKN